jgi:hypothetical protein
MLNKNRQILLADPLPPNLRVTLHTPHNPESLWIMTKQVAQYFCGDDADREISGQLSADVVPCLIQAYFKRYPLDAPKDYFQELCGGHPGCFNYVCVEELGHTNSLLSKQIAIISIGCFGASMMNRLTCW